mmetsp:Transcript_85215/g.178083  ORF Transcript_85215/g.178083 Transcript_85215/m.178083 type:complete len:154 (-) Transcript_85215:365-826(-)
MVSCCCSLHPPRPATKKPNAADDDEEDVDGRRSHVQRQTGAAQVRRAKTDDEVDNSKKAFKNKCNKSKSNKLVRAIKVEVGGCSSFNSFSFPLSLFSFLRFGASRGSGCCTIVYATASCQFATDTFPPGRIHTRLCRQCRHRDPSRGRTSLRE